MFLQYKSSGTTAIFSNIPMSLFDDFKKSYPKIYRIRYRGPRNTAKDLTRSFATRQSSCLKENAKTFSVYRY